MILTLSITEGGWPAAVEDTSEAEAVTVDLGTGLGAAEVAVVVIEAKETPRSLGRAPFDGKVLL